MAEMTLIGVINMVNDIVEVTTVSSIGQEVERLLPNKKGIYWSEGFFVVSNAVFLVFVENMTVKTLVRVEEVSTV